MKKHLLLLFLLPSLMGITASFAQTVTYSYTGTPQTYTVPPGILSVQVTAMGAGGGLNSVETYTTGCTWEDFPDRGGYGGCVICSLAVTPGTVLYLYAGGKGANGFESGCSIGIAGAGGWNGGGNGAYGYDQMAGGGGGGASDVRMGGTTLANRMVIAGGGGGAALNSVGSLNYERGGDGGTTTAENGWALGSATIGTSGNGGGGSTTGGVGGACSGCYGLAGTAGTLGVGGDGGGCCSFGAGSSGGGGGGGYFGGGGGQWGGAGGGSSYTDPVLCSGVVESRGCNTDTTDGVITITPICSAGLISGDLSICVPDTSTLSAVLTGGSWSSSNATVGTIDPSSGLFSSITAGTTIISYTITLACGTAASSATMVVNPRPAPLTVTSNAPLCVGMVDTLKLAVGPVLGGDVFTWVGPNLYTATASNPIRAAFAIPDSGTYRVICTNSFGCKDTGYIDVGLVPLPPAPTISGKQFYCQNDPFVPFTLSGYTGTPLWYTHAVGGVGLTLPLSINTTIPGSDTVWVSQVIGSCESPRAMFVVRVYVTPPAPLVTGTMQYCQFIGPFTPVIVESGSGDTALWYNSITGGTRMFSEPPVNINTPGTYNFWVSQTDTGCESPRTPVTIIVHPKPARPIITGQGPYCQYYAFVPAMIATPSETGDAITWYGPGLPGAGTSVAPVPQANVPKIDSFWVTETSPYGCVSDSSVDTARIIPQPPAPRATDTTYCQYFPAVPMNYQVDSVVNSRLNWYQYSVLMPTPTPSTNVTGTKTWYVSQTVRTCQSDSTPVTVTVLYLPKFSITLESPWVCYGDSMMLAYSGGSLQEPGYLWTLPRGDSFAHALGDTLTPPSAATDSMIYVKFDTVPAQTFIYLTTSDYNGRCFTKDTVEVTVIPQPTASLYTKPDVCIGDTVSLELTSQSLNATKFDWTVDHTASLMQSPALSVDAHSSNSGGSFLVNWIDTGMHVIEVNVYSEQGCASKPVLDTVHVHEAPDASFKLQLAPTTLCLEDSVLFVANQGSTASGYNYSYAWSPAHSFSNINQPTAWGRIEQGTTVITLTVTDPFGCVATSSTELEGGACCTVAFPNAFTPNGDGHNDYFYPLYTGYHVFHVFRIANRWGQTVYETTNSDMKWDGTYNGVPQDMGVYFYYVKYDCGGKTIEESGDVTLIR